MQKNLTFLRILKPVFFLCLIPLLFLATPALSDEDCDFEITIDFSPNVLNLESQGTVVTVHTDIPYSDVDPRSVYLISDGDSVAIKSWKADDRGYFVAKFSMSDVEMLELDTGELNTFMLVGETKSDENDTFCGEQDIMIIEIIPQEEQGQEQEKEQRQEQLQEQEQVQEQEEKRERIKNRQKNCD